MLTLRKSMNQYYSEAEAARTLCITLDALRNILDEHIFNDGASPPGSAGIYSCRIAFAFGVGRARARWQRGCHAFENLKRRAITSARDR